MNANAVATHYGQLTPEERFRLIFAAGVRGDQAEQQRLMASAERVRFSTKDYATFVHAFEEVAILTFIELLDAAAGYIDALWRADDAEDLRTWDDDAETDRGRRLTGQRSLDIALATGYLLKARADGWMQFCERLGVPPFALWELLPGYRRLQIALDMAEGSFDSPGAAFAPEGMLAWLNEVRPAGEAEIQKLALTPEWYANGAEECYRERAKWWGG